MRRGEKLVHERRADGSRGSKDDGAVSIHSRHDSRRGLRDPAGLVIGISLAGMEGITCILLGSAFGAMSLKLLLILVAPRWPCSKVSTPWNCSPCRRNTRPLSPILD